MTEQIVVGVDGSESALQATRWAAHEAALRDADVRLVHVRQLPLLLPAEDLYAQELTEQGRKWLSAARDAALDAAPDVDVHTDLRTGQPGEELVAETEDAGLVVVGSRGLGGFRSLLLGSVANALTAHGHCPVVVMRGRALPEDGPVVVGADGSPGSDNALGFALAAAAVRGVDVLAVLGWTGDRRRRLGRDSRGTTPPVRRPTREGTHALPGRAGADRTVPRPPGRRAPRTRRERTARGRRHPRPPPLPRRRPRLDELHRAAPRDLPRRRSR